MRRSLGLGTSLAILLGCSGADMSGSGGDRGGGGSIGVAMPGGFGAGLGAGAGVDAGVFDNGQGIDVPISMLPDMPFMDAGCGASSLEAEQVIIQTEVVHEMIVETPKPVALYVMLDQSASMQIAGLWDPAKVALKAFVNDAASAGLLVALDVFPPIFGEVGECTGMGYDVPMVAMGALPGNAMAINSALDAIPIALGGGTPIEGGLRGLTSFCVGYEASHPGEDCVAVLVTDGYPMGCAGETATLTGIVSTGAMNGVPTFAVGLMGADFALLDAIAMAGGAVDCDDAAPTFACDVSAGPAQLATALAKIRDVIQTVETTTEIVTTVEDTPLECEWTIPSSPDRTFDRDQVNVQFSAPSLAAPVALGRVDAAADCAANGWRYDDPTSPTRIVACEETCDVLQATPLAKVDILLGCMTVPLK